MKINIDNKNKPRPKSRGKGQFNSRPPWEDEEDAKLSTGRPEDTIKVMISMAERLARVLDSNEQEGLKLSKHVDPRQYIKEIQSLAGEDLEEPEETTAFDQIDEILCDYTPSEDAETPERRQELIADDSIRAWIDAFLVYDESVEPLPLDRIFALYLKDARAPQLQSDSEFRSAFDQAFERCLRDDDRFSLSASGIVQNAVYSYRWFSIPEIILEACAESTLNSNSRFKSTGLTDLGTVSSSLSSNWKRSPFGEKLSLDSPQRPKILDVLKLGPEDARVRIVEPSWILRKELAELQNAPDGSTLLLGPYPDPFPDRAGLEASSKLAEIVLTETNHRLNVLSRTVGMRYFAKEIPGRDRDRICYGSCIGTLDQEIELIADGVATQISQRLECHRWLQDERLRTASILCAVIPQADYSAYIAALSEELRWDRDEFIWCDALTPKSENCAPTVKALRNAGYRQEANRLEDALSSRENWDNLHCQPFFEAMTAVCPQDKLRFAVNITEATADYWLSQRHRGAVVVGIG